LFGGRSALGRALDTYFNSPPVDAGGQPDLETGNYGGHCQGNEPGHHVPYLYNAADVPWRTQEVLAELVAMYGPLRDGLPGNDDMGQMSAWLVWTMLGLYPVDPCGGAYELGRPFVASAAVKVGPNLLRIVRSKVGKYVQRVWWNARPLHATSIDHSQLMGGGVLRFEMGAKRTHFARSHRRSEP